MPLNPTESDRGYYATRTSQAARRLVSRLRQRMSEQGWLEPPRVAFVLSGGGNLGAGQVGMLRALVEAGVQPDVVIGCSVGALNGAAFAADPTSAGVNRIEQTWLRLAAGDPDLMPNRGLLPLAAQAVRRGVSLHDPEPLRQLLAETLPCDTFEELKVPFWAQAADLDAAEEYWFDSGPLVPALMASAALPAVLPPVVHHGRRLFDGGVLGEMPVGQAIASGATEIYLLQVGRRKTKALEIKRPLDVALHAYRTARLHRLEEDIGAFPENCNVHRLPEGRTEQLRFDDFTQAARLIASARAATARYLAEPEWQATEQRTPR